MIILFELNAISDIKAPEAKYPNIKLAMDIVFSLLFFILDINCKDKYLHKKAARRRLFIRVEFIYPFSELGFNSAISSSNVITPARDAP